MATETQHTEALRLVGEGASMRAAARAVGVSKTTVRRWAGTVPQEKNSDPAIIQETLQDLRERHLRLIAARLERVIDTADLKDLKDGYTAFGILDDKVMGRGIGIHVNAQANAQAIPITVLSNIPRPQFESTHNELSSDG